MYHEIYTRQGWLAELSDWSVVSFRFRLGVTIEHLSITRLAADTSKRKEQTDRTRYRFAGCRGKRINRRTIRGSGKTRTIKAALAVERGYRSTK